MWLLLLSALIVLLLLIGHFKAGTDWGGAHVNWIDGWVRIVCRYWHQLRSTTLALPDSGPAIVVANHVSGLDPLLLIAASRRPLRFLIASEEYQRPALRWLFRAAGCIPVDRHGRPEQALRQAMRALQQGEVIALFPHGKIHLDSDPPRRIKGGVVRLAAWSGAPVFPVRIDGVAAEGKVLTAPIIPSKVKLTLTEPLQVSDSATLEALEAITLAIETPGFLP